MDERKARRFRGQRQRRSRRPSSSRRIEDRDARGPLLDALDALDAHPDTPDLAAWLVADGGSDWQPYVDLLLEAEGLGPTSPAADA